MTSVERMLHDAQLRYQRERLRATRQTTENTVSPLEASECRGLRWREPASLTWRKQHRDYRPVGFYRIHCSHDRLLWDTCTTCRRDKREASHNLAKLIRGGKF